MGYYCTVPQCTSLAGKSKNVKFHRFPRDTALADKWNVILKRGKPYTKYSKVCSLHFTQADYNVTTMGHFKTLSKDAVPSQNLPKLNPDGSVMVIRKTRTVKYAREVKKEDTSSEKVEKWAMSLASSHSSVPSGTDPLSAETQDPLYRYPLHPTLPPAPSLPPAAPHRPRKQDAVMQTDPLPSDDDDDSQPDNSYSEQSASDYYKTANTPNTQKYEAKDYTKPSDDYLPQTNEEYNKEAEKYALERKSLNGYEKSDIRPDSGYQKVQEPYFDKGYQLGYQSYQDSVEMLRNQQHNLQILHEQHRLNENQNFFNENHIKQEIDISGDDDKYLYERSKEQLGSSELYRRMEPHHVKQEPDATGCETVMHPQGSPYYSNSHTNMAGYYEPLARPGPELLIAKQNALAAHTQLWQNTMKRPFFYSESPHYNPGPLLHRCDEFPRILQ